MAKKSAVLLPHDCVHCNKPIEKRCGETIQAYNKRKTCSRECKKAHFSTRKKKVITTLKHCVICGRVIVPHHNEGASIYANRKTCSDVCARKLQSKTQTGKPKKAYYERKDSELDERLRRLAEAHSLTSSLAGSFRK